MLKKILLTSLLLVSANAKSLDFVNKEKFKELEHCYYHRPLILTNGDIPNKIVFMCINGVIYMSNMGNTLDPMLRGDVKNLESVKCTCN